jgi:holliday junction DNA helicase RuvA
MIEYISGTVVELTPAYAVIETAGIGYNIQITLPVYSQLSECVVAKLYIYEAIREDAHILYGFLQQNERHLFLLLISVSGVGANTARMIMSTYSVIEIQEMIATANVTALNAIKGIGTKTAQRLIVDLKDKIHKVTGFDVQQKGLFSVNNPVKDEAVSALVMLGFASNISQKAVEQILKSEPDIKLEVLIKTALKVL